MKNNSWKPFVITLLVVVILLGMFYFPRISIGDKLLRRVNVLSEIQAVDKEGNVLAEEEVDKAAGIVEQKFDSAATKVKEKAYVDSIPDGMTAIEDFGGDQSRMMDHFYAALDEAKSRPIRIAYYSDSYIEGDIITGDLRELFQSKYGGCGVGFVDIHSITAGFRQTVKATCTGWTDHSSNNKATDFNNSFQGINGRYYICSSGTFELQCQNRVFGHHLDSVLVATVYFTPGSGLTVNTSINGKSPVNFYSVGGRATYQEETTTVKEAHVKTRYSEDSSHVYHDTTYTTREVHNAVGHQELGRATHKSINERIHTFRMDVRGGGSSRFYGVALDGTKGVSVDNMSMRGSTGNYIQNIPLETIKATNRPYDLIIVHFGLNIASRKRKDYSSYTSEMLKSIQHLRAAYPQAAILVVSVSDRDSRGSDGQLHTMPGVCELLSYQRKMASDGHVAFWNLYQAMGGDGSIAAMASRKEAGLDYTHINFKGGKRIAKILFDVLQNGKENYDRRK